MPMRIAGRSPRALGVPVLDRRQHRLWRSALRGVGGTGDRNAGTSPSCLSPITLSSVPEPRRHGVAAARGTRSNSITSGSSFGEAAFRMSANSTVAFLPPHPVEGLIAPATASRHVGEKWRAKGLSAPARHGSPVPPAAASGRPRCASPKAAAPPRRSRSAISTAGRTA